MATKPRSAARIRPVPSVRIQRREVGPVRQRQVEEGEPVVGSDLGGGDEVGALLAVVLGVHVGPGLDQGAGHVEVRLVGGGDQRGAVAVVDGGDAGALAQQRPHLVEVAVLRRLDQPQVVADRPAGPAARRPGDGAGVGGVGRAPRRGRCHHDRHYGCSSPRSLHRRESAAP